MKYLVSDSLSVYGHAASNPPVTALLPLPHAGAIVCNVQLYNPTLERLAAAPGIQGLKSSRSGAPLAFPVGLDNALGDCVLYNAMGAANMTQAAWDYMHTPKTADSWIKQDCAELLLHDDAQQGWFTDQFRYGL